MSFYDRPLAGPGLISYRYAGPYGWLMIGAKNDRDALVQAQRSTDEPVTPDKLERWNGTEYKPTERATA